MRQYLFLFLIALLATLFVACTEEQPLVEEEGIQVITPPDEIAEQGSVISLRLTDAPIALDEVNIDLLAVGYFIDDTVYVNEDFAGIYDLLKLQNGIDTLIALDTIDGEFLKEIRLVLGDNNTVVEDGVEYPLTIPSGSQSGLKIKVNRPIDGLDMVDILLDFDAEESVRQIGNGDFILSPVIKVVNFNGDPFEEEEDEENNGGGGEEDEEFAIDTAAVELIIDNYPGYERTDLDSSDFCIVDTLVIRVDIANAETMEAFQLVIGLDYNLLYEVRSVADEDIDPIWSSEIPGIQNQEFTAYNYKGADEFHEIRIMPGNNNSNENATKSHYVRDDGEVICKD